MKILIVSAAFYPENSPRSFRASELAKEFTRRGFEVTVITQARGTEMETFCLDNRIQLRTFPPLALPQIRIAGKGLLRFFTRVLNRVLLMLFEYPEIEYAWKVRRMLSPDVTFDLLISIAVPYPVHWGVASVWDRKMAKCWVADCGDPYFGNVSDSFRKPFYFRYIERWMFRKTDFITIPTEGARSAYEDEVKGKLRIIPQGIRFEDFQIVPSQRINQGIPTFGYAGSFIPGKRDPTRLLQYLIKLNTDFLFEIYTSTPGIVAEASRNSNGRIRVYGIIPRKELITRLSQLDFLIFVENSTNVQMPSKLIDYYLAKRPVLSVSGKFVNEEHLIQFMNGDYQSRMSFINFDQFRIETVVNQFVGILNEGQRRF